MMYILLILGFVLLIKGADLFVDGSSSAAKLLKVPSVIIGLTIVAMGTSAPEASVSIAAGLSGNSDIALSNVIGSNIFNLLMVVGVSAIICPVETERIIIKRDIWWSLGAAAAVFVMMLDMKISNIEGVLLLCAMAAYIIMLIRSARKNRVEGEEVKALSPLKSVLFIIMGLAAVILGGDLVVDNACLIAEAVGMSQTFIGLTIVAVGTSLPELVTSIVAARKGDSGLALGNVVGSNIFNLLFILGSASALTSINASAQLIADTAVLIAVTLAMYLICRTQNKTTRLEGLLCVGIYAAYAAYITIR
ncbi:MAG: calcium/sodium antiporter [Oscillospiraceae bacterium]